MNQFPNQNQYSKNLNLLCIKLFDQSSFKTIVYNYQYPDKTADKCMLKGTSTLYDYLNKGKFTNRRVEQQVYEEFFGMPFEVFQDIVIFGFSDDEQTVEERIHLYYLTHNQ